MGFIGVIDSGVGGLTILQKLRKDYSYNLVYIADHAFCPYGTKPNDVIFSRADKLVAYLKSRGAQAVVLACNTMSCFAQQLQQSYNLPVYDVIAPTCRLVVANNPRKVALLATRSTIANGAYQQLLSQHGIQTVTFDCSAFVPFVEQRATTSIACQRAVDDALCNLPTAQADTVILGCTHFPLLCRQIAYYCKDSRIVECSCSLPNDLYFAQSSQPTVSYFTTGDADFADTAANCFNSGIRFSHILLT